MTLEKFFEKTGCHVLNSLLAQYYQYMGFIVLTVGFTKNSDNCIFLLSEIEMLTSLFKKWTTNNVLHLNKAIWPICKGAILQVWSCNYRHMYFSHPSYKFRLLYILPRSSISSSEVTPPCISSKNEIVQHKPIKIRGSSGL